MPDTFATDARKIEDLVDLLTCPEALAERLPEPPHLAEGLAELQTLLDLEQADLEAAIR